MKLISTRKKLESNAIPTERRHSKETEMEVQLHYGGKFRSGFYCEHYLIVTNNATKKLAREEISFSMSDLSSSDHRIFKFADLCEIEDAVSELKHLLVDQVSAGFFS